MRTGFSHTVEFSRSVGLLLTAHPGLRAAPPERPQPFHRPFLAVKPAPTGTNPRRPVQGPTTFNKSHRWAIPVRSARGGIQPGIVRTEHKKRRPGRLVVIGLAEGPREVDQGMLPAGPHKLVRIAPRCHPRKGGVALPHLRREYTSDPGHPRHSIIHSPPDVTLPGEGSALAPATARLAGVAVARRPTGWWRRGPATAGQRRG